MNISDYRVEPADYNADFDDLRTIREAVFVVEQNIPQDLEFDGIDPECLHFVARDNQHEAIGTARLAPDHTVGRMAVLENWRGKGVGKALLLAVIEKAQKLGFTELTLKAQTDVIGFYEHFNFKKEGDIFTIAKIPHQLMRVALEPIAKSTRPTPKPGDATVEIAEFTNLADAQAAAIQIIQKARRQLCIYSPDLEPVIYGSKEVIEALKQFAINSGGGEVKIIVQDTLAVRAQPHPLIDLAQRLSSVFMLRTPTEPNDLQYPSAYIINDRDGYLFRQQSSQYRGVWSPNMPARNRQLSDDFDSVWQRCRVCSEFRALGL